MASDTHERLNKLGITLPEIHSPGANYIPARTVGKIVYLAGVISSVDGAVIMGTAGLNRTTEEGYAAARACAITQLGVLKRHLGSLDLVRSIISLNGYVNAVTGFEDTPQVINGASDLLIEVFGESGRHVRAAIGVSALPKNALVEIQMTVELAN
jgi:enamine deaminase RidA (YjgF/YER057c/UK114 family)